MAYWPARQIRFFFPTVGRSFVGARVASVAWGWARVEYRLSWKLAVPMRKKLEGLYGANRPSLRGPASALSPFG